MSSFRRPRIKASVTHLASLAGKRRVVVNATVESQTENDSKNNEDSRNETEKPVIEKTADLESTEQSLEEPKKAQNHEPTEEKTVDETSEETAKKPTASERPRLKSRFRPNFGENKGAAGKVVRLRKTSNSESGLGSPSAVSFSRIRTTSSGSNDSSAEPIIAPDNVTDNSENEDIQVQQQVAKVIVVDPQQSNTELTENETLNYSPKEPLRTRKISENNCQLQAETVDNSREKLTNSQEKMPNSRTRKLSESSVQSVSTVYKERKANHLKKFKEMKPDEIPEQTKLTMFDLIYYNPTNGSKMSNPSSRMTSRAPSPDRADAQFKKPLDLNAVAEKLREEAVDDPDAIPDEEETEEDATPAPQVKVGADGNIILDEASLMIETTNTKKAKNDLITAPLVFESANSATNYGTWSKRKKKNADWSSKKTIKFYKALSVFGTDFSLMQGVFTKKSRKELQLKFKKEEKVNNKLIEKCLSQGQAFDPSIFESDDDTDQEEEEQRLEIERKKEEKKEKAKERKKKTPAERKKERAEERKKEKAEERKQKAEEKKLEKAEEKKKKAEEKKREKAEGKKIGNKPNKGKVAKPRGRKSRVTSREEMSSSSSENEFNCKNGSISENGSESDPILDLIEESNLIESPSEILPDPLEVLPETAFENDSITEDNPSEYEMQRMENIADKNTFLKKSTKLLDTKVPPKIKRKTKLIIPTSEDSPLRPPAAKKSKPEISNSEPLKDRVMKNSEPLKSRVMPKRRAAAKSPMSYAENHEIEENPMDSDESLELPSLPPALLAANPDLANISSGSLVVVGSSNSDSAFNISQVLEVYNESEEESKSEILKDQQSAESESLFNRTRTISEGHLDTTSIGRVRTHSGSYGT